MTATMGEQGVILKHRSQGSLLGQADFAKPMGVAPVNIEASGQLASDPVISRFMLLPEQDLVKTYALDNSGLVGLEMIPR